MTLVSVSGGKSSQFTNEVSNSGDLYGDEGKCNIILFYKCFVYLTHGHWKHYGKYSCCRFLTRPVPVTGWHMPGCLKLFLCRSLHVCVCVCM